MHHGLSSMDFWSSLRLRTTCPRASVWRPRSGHPLRPRVPRTLARPLARISAGRHLALDRLDFVPRSRSRALQRQRVPAARSNCEQLWFWFRDNWGVVWALRVLERFNRAAEVSHWPVRLTWFGLVSLSEKRRAPRPPSPDELETTFRNLMTRFADSWRLDQVTKQASSGSSDRPPERAAGD